MKLTRVTALALGATFVGALLAGTAANAADQNRWPASKVGTPAPKVKGMPPELAKNLANFDDLDFPCLHQPAMAGPAQEPHEGCSRALARRAHDDGH